MKIISLVGARPQFIKEAIVGNEIRKLKIDHILVNTGQHYDPNMSDDFIQELFIKKPDYNLEVGSGTHAYQTAMTMLRFEDIVMKEKPDFILVYGDTNATIAGAIVGSKLKIPIAHVEAGLRQNPKDMPEEINRVITDHISTLLFCPTKKSLQNLEFEGLIDKAYLVGDVMYDLFNKLKPTVDLSKIMQKYSLKAKKYIFATIHRDFNTDNPERLKNILSALKEINKKEMIILPLHPRTKKAIEKSGLISLVKDIRIIDPISYIETITLLLGAKKIITDSGGLQKEAYFAGVSAIVLMPDTGWIELIEENWNILVDANKDKIIEMTLFNDTEIHVNNSIFGDGSAGKKIAEILFQKLNNI